MCHTPIDCRGEMTSQSLVLTQGTGIKLACPNLPPASRAAQPRC